MLIPLGIWAAAGAGGGSSTASYDFISTTYGNGSSTSVTFDVSSLASTYKHLQIRFNSRYTASGDNDVYLRFNGDSTSALYADHRLIGNPSVPNVLSQSNSANDRIQIRGCSATSGTQANELHSAIVDILDFGSSSKNKTVRYLSGGYTNFRNHLGSGLWASTSPITSITLGGTLIPTTASRFSLYGIRG
jgi:hypothetical protein